jgi:hypothetical protein
MLERRRELGLPEVGLPTAADIDAARRADAGDAGRDLATGPVVLVAPLATPAPPVAAGPVPAAGEGLLTAPRRTTGPLAVAKVAAIAPLPPEPPRRPRAPVSEVIERASGPMVGLAAGVPGLDDEVDLAAAIARARALAGGALDAELEALCEVSAAPREISVEAASAELARQLGGSAVRRDRSAGWAPPPATSSASPDDARSNGAASNGAARAAPVAEDAAPVAPEPAGMDAAPAVVDERVAEQAAPVAAAGPDTAADPGSASAASAAAEREADASSTAAEREADASFAAAGARTGLDPAPDLAAIQAPDDEDDHGGPARPSGLPHTEPIRTEHSAPVAALFQAELALADLDSDEHTELGERPVAAGFEPPVDPDELAAAEAELAAEPASAAEPPLELGVDEFDDFEIIAEADAADEDLLASHGDHDASSRRDLAARPPSDPRRPSELDFAARLDLGDDSDLYLGASADELSAGRVIDSLQDELTSQHSARRERFAQALPDPHAVSAGAALAALETGDEAGDEAGDDAGDDAGDEAGDDAGDEAGDDAFDESEVTDDPDAYAQRVVRPIFDPDPSSSVTLAGIPSDSIDVDIPAPRHPGPIEPPRPAHRSDPIEPPRPARRHAPLSLHEAPVEDYELEHALQALDVDLDDLAIPHAATQLPRELSRPTPQLRPQPASPAPGGRVAAPTPAPPRAVQPTPPPPRRVQPTPAPPRTAAPTPSRAVHPTGLGAPGSGRIASPRAPSEGVDIDFDDDD